MASINLNIGGGIVEIAALTALIGATTGESLILGSRGAAGLPWAAMSLFGTPFLIRACISARTPTWLREMIGVKNAKCDTMVGMSSRIERVARSDVTQKNIAGISALVGLAREPLEYFDPDETGKVAKGYYYDHLRPSKRRISRTTLQNHPQCALERPGPSHLADSAGNVHIHKNLTKYGNIYMARFPSIVVSGSVHVPPPYTWDRPHLTWDDEADPGTRAQKILVHPRTQVCYQEDTQDPSTVYQLIKTCELLFDKAQVALEVGLEQSDPSKPSTEVEIKAVISDTLLSSIAWILGYPDTCIDVYDCCLVALEIAGRTVIIPSARVLSGNVKKAGALLGPRSRHFRNDGVNIGWVFWIPLGAGQRLHLIGDLSFTGRQRMEVLSSEDVTKRLNVGNLYIGLRDVHDVQNVVEKSCRVGRLLINLLKEESDQQKYYSTVQYCTARAKLSSAFDTRLRSSLHD
ncbi:uncharacterized protein MCYG_06609 [Microsporum canis CBS 113480]|uniref:Uncharacterized protein n=1 Tax=Arthroderma otae (strain ATCC MYA-4605 / CBS 113480) TaxID=554155 RepID=C5FV56_ARTOC|nr:uncharacterized protein MCYG_06609 [Microsporum canis CBS 113480]EEQ33790.1 hypothetical protein MCYG_06609 [Microsporum canis CBS 113480]